MHSHMGMVRIAKGWIFLTGVGVMVNASRFEEALNRRAAEKAAE
jgi:hypothetical protein